MRQGKYREYDTLKATAEERSHRLGGVTGRGFFPGQSGSPGGRPKGLARYIRDQTRDGEEIAELMLGVLRGENAEATVRDRMAAATWLADRGLGRPVLSGRPGSVTFDPTADFLGIEDHRGVDD
jgi:hypothetical protein